MARGGKRKGAGRKKTSDPTIVMRIPESKKGLIKQWLSDDFSVVEQRGKKATSTSISKALDILKNALNLKANAGGKIKAEIRTAMIILQGYE